MLHAKWAATFLLPWSAGCAVVTTAEDGSRTIAGLVYITLPAPHRSAVGQADSLRTRALGLSLTQAEAGAALSFGWSDSTLAVARGSACLAIDGWR